MRQPDRDSDFRAPLARNLPKIPPRLVAVPFPLRRPAAFFRWETTAACRTTSFGIQERTNEVCAPHPTCVPPIFTIPLVLTIPPCALFVSPCSFHHPHARVHLSPPNALTFSVHVQALAAGFRRESAILAPNPPNPTIDPLLIPPTTPL